MEPDRIQYFLLSLPVILLSLTVHEFAHAYVALRQGDDTAYMLGRVTLDPRAHLDPIGSLLFPAMALLSGMPLLGWAKPVPTNPRKYRKYKRGDILVSIAGVTANLLLAVVFALLAAVVVAVATRMASPPDALGTLVRLCEIGVLANIGLFFFNLIPIPPLDGSHVLVHLLPVNLANSYRQLMPYGMIILWVLVLTGGFRFLGGLIYTVASVFFIPAGWAQA